MPTAALPPSFRRAIERAAAAEPDPSRRAQLLHHYFEGLPGARADQLDRDAPGAKVFHAPIDWSRTPRLTAAVRELHALAKQSGCTWPGDALARSRTVTDLYSATFFGESYALLHGTRPLVKVMLRELREGRSLEEVVDRHFAAPLVHELAHGPRTRDLLDPPFLDECVAGWLCVRVMPEFAFPARGEANGIYATPRLSQVGQMLARTFGEERVVEAHLGRTSWDDAVPPGVARRLRELAWSEWQRERPLHFLPTRPRSHAWMKLFCLAAAGAAVDVLTLDELDALPWRDVPVGPETPMDQAILRDALATMCLHARLDDGVYRVSMRAPLGPVKVDLETCVVTTDRFADDLSTEAPTYVFPPSIAARLRSEGASTLQLVVNDRGVASEG